MISLTVATRGYSGADGSGLTLATWGYVRQTAMVASSAEAPCDFLAALAIAPALPITFTRPVERDASIPFDTLNYNALVTGSIDTPLDWLAEITWSPAMMIESLASVTRAFDTPPEYLQAAALEVVAPVISDREISGGDPVPAAWAGWLRADKLLEADFTSLMASDRLLAVDIRTAVAASVTPLISFLTTIAASRRIPVAVSGGWGEMVFLHPRGTVHFYKRPVRPGASNREMFQQTDRDSDGARYAYTKAPVSRSGEALEFHNLDSYTLTTLLWFFEEGVRGMRDLFTWYDWTGGNHTVRFAAARIEHRQTGPDSYTVSFRLIEDLSL